jgi:hypothetical protein
MARQARGLSVTGFYHIVFRGINRQHLFEEENDFMERWGRSFFVIMERWGRSFFVINVIE